MSSKHKILTRQGYILSKKKLDKKKLAKIKNDLEVTPEVHPDYAVDVESFKIYAENKESITVPRYYGEKNFGKPTKIVPMNENKININFKGKLREKQKPIVEKCLESIKKNGGGIISLPCGAGKCLSLGTPILMYNGSIKNVEDIKVGDKLMGDDSKPRTVLSLARGREEMYDIIPIKGPKYTVNKSHILSLKYNTIKPSGIKGSGYTKKFEKGDILDISVDDYLNLSKYYHGRGSPLRGYRTKVNFRSKKVELDPYILGLWLGDGSKCLPQITNVDKEPLDYLFQFAEKHNLKATPIKGDEIRYNISRKNKKEENYFLQQLRKMKLLNNKHIPKIYKCNSRRIRLELLAGFIDADGHQANKGFDICQKREILIDDIIFIARSLDLAAYKTECWKTCTNAKGGPKKGKYYRTNIHGDTDIIPTKIKRKQAQKRKQIKDVTVYGIKVVPIGIDDYYGFEIDGNKRFLLGDFTVTHNTTIALYLASQLGLKTLVVVHKTFLQDQWYERIKQFLPNAKIGMIRQKHVDIDGKDIVVGMLHSISMIDYDSEIFKEFGILCFDECFVRREIVLTNKGPVRIGKLYDMWNDGEELPLIKSFNEKTKQFEFKKMTYAWKKKAKRLVRVKMGKRCIICTPKHKYLTVNGYKQANKLNSNDIIIGMRDDNLQENVFAKGLNDDQIQIILGSFLGDCNIDILSSKRYRLKEIHGIDQKEYCAWKASIFGVYTKYIKENGYASKPAVYFQTKIFDFSKNFPKSKKKCPQWIIDKIDWRAIAIWIMDDGSLSNISPRMTISTCSFDEDSQERLVKKLESLGIPCLYYKDKRGHYYIAINENGTKKLMSEIYKYIHPSMMKKLSTKSLTKYIEDIQRDHSSEDTYNYIYNIPKDMRIQGKVYYGKCGKRKVKYCYRYCLNCKDNTFHTAKNKKYCTTCKNKKDKYTYDIDLNNKYKWNKEFLDYGTCKITSVTKQQVKKRYKYVYDIEVEDNHNFIIGSKSKKENGPIVHNCHHLGAKVFSRAMMKTGGHYTIGLSATPYRSDGLTRVIKWYLGDIIYRLEREGDKNVFIKIFDYKTNDPLFKEKKQWMKGKIKPSVPKMISNIGKIEGRNKFIIKIINVLRNQPDRKILILSNRIAHLEYLKEEMDKIIKEDEKSEKLEPDEITTAFYIGRLKRYELVDSAEADIIFASYAMAEEGLDIDQLNTLVFATPKKNIIQSIGRILRKPIKEGDINPLIVDINDQFSVFESWSKKRIKYYEKNKYTINTYQSWDENCISIRDYLIRNNVIEKNSKDVDIRKEFICHKYGYDTWELEEDLRSEGEEEEIDEEQYNYDPDLNKLLKIDLS